MKNERAKRIKELVEQSGKSYQELSNVTGVAKSSLQRYASGVTTKIPLDVIDKLEKTFDVPRGYIMGWEKDDKKEKPTAQGDGLTENQRILMEFAKNVPDDKAEMVLRVIRSIVEAD